MEGRPVWLASVSRRVGGEIRATGRWAAHHFREAERIAHEALKDAGDAGRERAFRMNVTFCVHRALCPFEVIKLPPSFFTAEGGLAGPPVEILWSRGIRHTLAAMPCEEPRHLVIDPLRPDLWVPEGCGKCSVCDARAAA